ncbi:hypothetical protein [Sphingomonas sp. GB1N7]|uniref:hypothetical protein n=1 Tax=Parasphingomonas caseinilytica TaxID=3096158 RepID=UPI002FCAD95B
MGRYETVKRSARVGCFFLVAMLCGAALLVWGHFEWKQGEKSKALDRSLNQEGAIKPRWIRESRPCKPPNTRELAQDTAMSNLAKTFAGKPSSAGLYYVVSYFGWHWSIIDQTTFSEQKRCPPAPDLYRQIAPILERADWLRPAQESNDLELIERLPPSSYIAKRLGETAFDAYPLTHNPLGYDNRPYLRMLLAYQGAYARPWAKRALSAITPDTKLGTSAAFLAVATVPDQALPRVAAAMRRFIAEARGRQVTGSDIGPGQGFAIRDGDRLFELAYALSIAGPKAEPYSEALIELFDQRFGAGSHFGLLLLEPKGLCPVARQIGGRAAAAANAKPYCNVTEKD